MYLQVEKLTLKHDMYIVRNILRFGVISSLESNMFQLGKILFLSTASVVTNAISNTPHTFQYMVGNALGWAIVTVVSQSVGAGDYEKARFYTKRLLKMIYPFLVIYALSDLLIH